MVRKNSQPRSLLYPRHIIQPNLLNNPHLSSLAQPIILLTEILLPFLHTMLLFTDIVMSDTDPLGMLGAFLADTDAFKFVLEIIISVLVLVAIDVHVSLFLILIGI